MLADSVRNHRHTVLTSFTPVRNVYESSTSRNVLVNCSSEAMFNVNKESCVMRRSDDSTSSDANKSAFVESKKVCPKMFIESDSTLAHEASTKNMACSFNDAFSAFITQKSTKRSLDDIDYVDEVAPINQKIARVEFKPKMKSMILKNNFENKTGTSSRTAISRDLMKPCKNGVMSGGTAVNDAPNINNSARTESFLNFITKSTKKIQKVVVDTNGTLAEKERIAEKERSFRAACDALANLSKKNVADHRVVGSNSLISPRIESGGQVDRNGVIESNVRVSRSSVNQRPGFNSGLNTCLNEFTSASSNPALCNLVRNQTNNCKSRDTTCKQSGNNFVMKTNEEKLRNNVITRATTNGLSYDVNTASIVGCTKTALPLNSEQNCRRSSLRRKSYDVCDTSLLGSYRNPIDCTTNNYYKHNASAGRGRSSSVLFPGCQPVYVSLERLTLNKIERIKNQLKMNIFVASLPKLDLPRKLESPRKRIDASVDPPAVTQSAELPVIINDCSNDSFQMLDFIVADLEADLLSSFEESKTKLEKMSPGRKRLSTINSQTSSLPDHYLYEETSQDSEEFNNQSLAVLSECKKSKKKKSELILPISSKKLNETRLALEYVPNFMTHDDCGQELKRNATFLLSEWWLNDYDECTDITSMISNLSDWYKIDESWRKKKFSSKKNLCLEKFDDCASRDSFLSTEQGETTKIDDVKSATDLSFQIDDNAECFFLRGVRASQCEATVNKMEDLFHSNKPSTTLLQFYLPDKRQKKCYTRLVSRGGRRAKTTNNVGENEVDESMQSVDADHFLKSISLYTVELSLHEILWPPELLANLNVPEMDATQSEQLPVCETKLADKLKETISLESEIKPNSIKNDIIEIESKADKKTKRPRIKKVVVYDSIGSDGLIVSLPKPAKCSVRKTYSARVKKSEFTSSIIKNVTSLICITNNERIESVDSNIDNNIDKDVNGAVNIIIVNDASSIDVGKEQESILKVNNTCSSPVVGISKVIYDETGNILVKPKRRPVVRARVSKKNSSKAMVVPPSEVVESSLISVLIPRDAIGSSDNVHNLVPSDQTVLRDVVTTLAPSDKSDIVDSTSVLVACNINTSGDSISVLAPSEANCVSVPSASIVCSKQKTAVKRVRKKKQSDITAVTNESSELSVLVTESSNCEPADSNTVQESCEPSPKKKAAPRKRPPRKKKSESNNVASEISNIGVSDNISNPSQDSNHVQISSESEVKRKTVVRKRPPRKRQSVEKHTLVAEENSLISVSNSFMFQENSNSLQQFCADISLNSFGASQCDDTVAVLGSCYSEQRYNDSQSISTDFVSMSNDCTGVMDNASNSVTLGSDFVQGINDFNDIVQLSNHSNQMSGDLTNNSFNSDQVCGSYLPVFGGCRQPMTTDFIEGSCTSGSVSNDFNQGSYHSSQLNHDVVQGAGDTSVINYNFAPCHNDLESNESNLEQMDCNSYQMGSISLEMNRNSNTNVTHTVPPSSTGCGPDITAEVMNYDGGDDDISSWLAASMGL